MKKMICTLLALLMLLSLAACGGGSAQPQTSAEAPAPTQKAKLTPQEVAEALDKADSADDLKQLIDALEGAYGETEPITLDGDSITLAQLRELYQQLRSGGGDTPSGSAPSSAAAAEAVGTWTGVYCKFVGDEEGVTDEPFSLVLNADGTGTHSRDELDISVTWTLDGEDFAMTESFLGATQDYTGTLTDGVLHLFNGDPGSDLTYEYVYGQGDVSGIEIPHAEAPAPAPSGGSEPAGDAKATGLDAYRGDWNGLVGFRSCTGKYEYLDNDNVGALARFAVQDDGTIQAFIGLYVEDTPIVDLTAQYSDFWETLMLSGSWINVPFENVPATVENGTLSFVIPISKEAGSLYLVFNLRRFDDEGWTNEDPRMSATDIEYCRGKTFGELAGMMGYDFLDYPSPDEG